MVWSVIALSPSSVNKSHATVLPTILVVPFKVHHMKYPAIVGVAFGGPAGVGGLSLVGLWMDQQ